MSQTLVAEQLIEQARQATALEHFDSDSFDVHYQQLTREPIESMCRRYAQLGDEFTTAAEAGMQAWLHDNPQDKFGKHEYKLAQFGLDPTAAQESFARYLSRYDVEREG